MPKSAKNLQQRLTIFWITLLWSAKTVPILAISSAPISRLRFHIVAAPSSISNTATGALVGLSTLLYMLRALLTTSPMRVITRARDVKPAAAASTSPTKRTMANTVVKMVCDTELGRSNGSNWRRQLEEPRGNWSKGAV